MPAVKHLLLAAAMTALTAPAWASLTYTATGAWAVGSSSSAGSTPVAASTCGIFGQNAARFDGAGDDNIGVHAYACDDALSSFGSRASGENNFYAQGVASLIGSIEVAEGGSFSIFINPGEVGAFGSTAFGVDEFQKSRLTIQLLIDGVAYLDEAWSAEVVAGSASGNHTSGGSRTVAFNTNGGADYFSYGFTGGEYTIDLDKGAHDISYVMTSEAWGQVAMAGVCTGFLQPGTGGVETTTPTGEPFTAYCGAGARSGDPFNDPIARLQLLDTPLPEPMTAGLALTALLAAAGARRRSRR